MTPIYNDSCLAFQIEEQDIKGRIIRLDRVLNDVLGTHNYPDDVKRQLGQAMALTAMLGSMMKYDGILTLQIRSDGLIRTLVSDFSTDGSGSGVVRGYCGLDEGKTPVLGDGQLMITMDQGKYMDRYQGIVKLDQGSLKESAEEYFQTSEQLPTHLMISCDRGADGRWSAAAIMIQHLAGSPHEDSRDHWTTATALLSTVKASELLDKGLSLQDLLLRLFHESGVRVFTATEMRTGCRCSEEKLRTVLASFSTEELKDCAEDGIITMTCEFCMTDHKFELKKLIN
ncbi:MAG: Hsp33 family molecular chaperone [Alphaproteobacteria bacterium]|nr:MAG: Hsp33 family molecular chaperone [Alphaproteobacteria bacterium]